IASPAEHFDQKRIRATGTVKEVDKIPRIEIDDARQIRIVEPTAPAASTAATLARVEALGGRASLDPAGEKIVQIYLGGTKTSDADLAWIGKLTDLVELSLANTKITDAGLPNLTNLKKLEALHLADNRITDLGVAAIKDLTQLQLLGLKGTQVSDAGLAH